MLNTKNSSLAPPDGTIKMPWLSDVQIPTHFHEAAKKKKAERTEKHYLNSHNSEDKLCVCLRKVGLHLRRQTDQGTVGEHGNNAHGLERQLEQRVRKEEREREKKNSSGS